MILKRPESTVILSNNSMRHFGYHDYFSKIKVYILKNISQYLQILMHASLNATCSIKQFFSLI